MERLQITTLTAQDISAALLVATYTATAAKELLINLHLSGLAGGGAYRACLTRQIAGAGAAYQSPTTVISVSGGVTTALLSTTPLAVNSGDVVRVYAQGLAGDTSVGVVVEVFDLTAATPGDVQTSVAISSTQAVALAQNCVAIRFFYAVSVAVTSTIADDLDAAGSKLYLAVKEEESDSDDDALVLVERTEGLLRLAKAAAADPTKGSLTLGGATGAWTILFWLDQTVTGSLAAWKGNRYVEIKHLPAAGDPLLVTTGRAVLSYGIVQANT
ncbi:MAG: hypothetical protein GXY76_08795 [Chloroflexi bacterium]|nr:hypothetical protein [Chloroflexota bacterium]